jgi:hypothetical protein
MRASTFFLLSLALTYSATASTVDFARDVFPVLRRACFECHGAEKQNGDLRLDTSIAVQHPSIQPGKPDASELMRRVMLSAEDKEAMPRRGPRLSKKEVDHLRAWIAQGAVFPESIETPKHWSYLAPSAPALPAVADSSWVKNEIDRFVLERLEQAGMKPSSEPDAAVLLRRLSFDTRGLPPTPAEVAEFEKGYVGEQKERVWMEWVDRLLRSPDFGPKWARHWLDLARYADSHGFQRDDLRNIWGYRDWVVNALNADMPFDQFTIEQVAGDLLPNATPSQIIATGFHRCTPTNVEAGTDPEESRINQVIDRVNTTGAVWLGTTLECAQCHNHKYDPISITDYYNLLAYFNNTAKEAERSNPNAPGSIRFLGAPYQMTSPQNELERERLSREITALNAKMEAHSERVAARDGTKTRPLALKPDSFETDASAEYDLLPDHSVLLAGPVPEKDTYHYKAALSQKQLTGILIEAMSDESLPGNGPGRGSEGRPNFVLTHLHAALDVGGEQAQEITFASAVASFSQANFPVANLADADETTGWAINPEFGKSHWAALKLREPMALPDGSHLSLRLVQNFGGGRVIGRLRITAIEGDFDAALPELSPAVSRDRTLARLQKELTGLKAQLAALAAPTTEVMKELSEPRMTAVFKRGDWRQPAEAAAASTPEVFDLKANGPPNRLTFAKWLASDENPLTARVTVNRWWAEIFGTGIVSTVEDFGIKGEPPSHPELLDYLATWFMQNDWSMKRTLRKMFLSATYRQSSVRPVELKDPANVLLSRGNRFRLDAEAIRDNALAISGLLNPSLGGPSIRPPQPDGLWTKVGGQNYKYEVSLGDEQYRRGIYVVLKRGSPYPSMINFDASARMACVVKRSRSNTPLQALTLLNDPVYVEAANAFAERIANETAGQATAAQLSHAMRIAVGRIPSEPELRILQELYHAQGGGKKGLRAVATSLLNLDETVSKP